MGGWIPVEEIRNESEIICPNCGRVLSWEESVGLENERCRCFYCGAIYSYEARFTMKLIRKPTKLRVVNGEDCEAAQAGETEEG